MRTGSFTQRSLVSILAPFFVMALTLTLILAPGLAAAGDDLTVRQAHDMALKGEILLVDIRSPGEWRQSGVAPEAMTISMHEEGFYARLDEAVKGDHSRPVAVICAAGGRSAMMRAQLVLRGYTNVSNVPAGMTGGPNGPGWIASGLPVVPYRQ